MPTSRIPPESRNGTKAETDLSEEAPKNDSVGSGIGNGSSGSAGSFGVEARGGGDSDKAEEGGCLHSSTAEALREAYNGCLSALGDFR